MSIANYKIILVNGETVVAEQVGLDTYRLLENPVFSCQINYGTIVRALPSEKGNPDMVKIIRVSDFFTRQFLTSPDYLEDTFKATVGKEILEAGGAWETAMGGILFIHIPRKSDFDLDASLKQYNINLAEIKE
jgi:hypothetical protein